MTTPKPPTIGPTGSPVTTWSATAETDISKNYRFPPQRPTETYTIFDADHTNPGAYYCAGCDAWHLEVTRTPTQMQEALSRYHYEKREWERTNGMHLTAGATTYQCEVECADGTTGRAVWTGEEWRWAEYEIPGRPVNERMVRG